MKNSKKFLVLVTLVSALSSFSALAAQNDKSDCPPTSTRADAGKPEGAVTNGTTGTPAAGTAIDSTTPAPTH